MNAFNLCEAYAAVYDEDLRNEISFSLEEEFDIISELYDYELEEIVEETIIDLLDEGYEFEDIEEIFEEVLFEAKVTMGRGGEAGEGRVTTGSGSRMAAVDRLAARKARKRKEAVEKVKGAVKKTLSDVKSAAKEAKFKTVDAPAARYASRRGIGGPAPGLQARAKDPAKRRALRGAVLKDIASRAKAKIGRGIESATATGQRAVGAVKSSSDIAQQTMRGAGSEVKRGAKGLVAGAARAVSRGARDVARRMAEDVDLYDVILEHILDEGYADTEEAATVIMANMSEEWREEILDEAYVNWRTGKLPSGRTPRQAAANSASTQAPRARMKIRAAEGPLADTTNDRYSVIDARQRAAKSRSVSREMDAHTSFGGRINKILEPGLANTPGAGPRVAYGQPNTLRHQLAMKQRGERSAFG